jgi:DNA-binding response OmpR family regulator
MTELSARAFRSCLIVSTPPFDSSALVRALHGGGFAVLERPRSDAADRLARSREFDIVLWHVPAASGEDLEALGRLARANVPTIALVNAGTGAVVGACLEAGAEAVLQEGAEDVLVIAQVHAVLRRFPSMDMPEASGVLQVGDLSVDIHRCEVTRGGRYVPLTVTEFRILEQMAKHAGRVLKPHEILNAVSDDYVYQAREAQDVFKVYARRIRRKLEEHESEPVYLVTVRGFGYRLEGGAPRERAAGSSASA